MEIKPYPRNAKKHPKKHIEQVAASIKEFGMNQPIVVDKDGVIIVGHGRYEALKHLGWSEEEIMKHVKVADLSEEQAKAYRLADNKLNESDWDMGLAIEELKGLSDEMFELTGFDKDLLIEPDEKDDQIPDNAPTIAKLGDIWQLGRHRVGCMDSTDKDSVARLMEGNKADMVFTDPPYGVNLDTDYSGMPSRWNDKEMYQNKFRKVIGDEKKFDAGYILLLAKEVFLWGANYYANTLPNAGIDGTYYVWDKREDDDGKSFDKMLGSPFEMCWGKKKRGMKFIRMRWASFLHGKATDGEASKNRIHPTQKPVALCYWFTNKFCKENDIVLDLFLGSGSTLIACEKTNRICYGMEIDPKYVDVIIKRWEDYTNQKAIKL